VGKKLLSVDITPVADLNDGYQKLPIVDFVDDAKIADADSPAIPACQFNSARWSWVGRKSSNSLSDCLKIPASDVL